MNPPLADFQLSPLQEKLLPPWKALPKLPQSSSQTGINPCVTLLNESRRRLGLSQKEGPPLAWSASHICLKISSPPLKSSRRISSSFSRPLLFHGQSILLSLSTRRAIRFVPALRNTPFLIAGYDYSWPFRAIRLKLIRARLVRSQIWLLFGHRKLEARFKLAIRPATAASPSPPTPPPPLPSRSPPAGIPKRTSARYRIPGQSC